MLADSFRYICIDEETGAVCVCSTQLHCGARKSIPGCVRLAIRYPGHTASSASKVRPALRDRSCIAVSGSSGFVWELYYPSVFRSPSHLVGNDGVLCGNCAVQVCGWQCSVISDEDAQTRRFCEREVFLHCDQTLDAKINRMHQLIPSHVIFRDLMSPNSYSRKEDGTREPSICTRLILMLARFCWRHAPPANRTHAESRRVPLVQ